MAGGLKRNNLSQQNPSNILTAGTPLGRTMPLSTVRKRALWSKITLTADAAIPTGTATRTRIPMNSIEGGCLIRTTFGEMYMTGLADGMIVVPEEGAYHVSVAVAWDTTVTAGRRSVGINAGGVSVAIVDQVGSTLPSTNNMTIQKTLHLQANAGVYIDAVQDSGSSINVVGTPTRTFFTIVRLS